MWLLVYYDKGNFYNIIQDDRTATWVFDLVKFCLKRVGR